MLDADLKTQLQGYLERISQPVEIVVSPDGGDKSREMQELLADIQTVSSLGKIDAQRDETQMKPSFALRGPGSPARVRFAGVPMGHEFTSLVLALLQTGGYPPKIDDAVAEQIRNLDGDYNFICVSSRCASILTRLDTDWMSANSSCISRDLSPPSGDTTISTGCEMRSRYPCNCVFRSASSMACSLGQEGPSACWDLQTACDPRKLDLADQAERRLERLRARSPLRRAHFARMRRDILRAVHLPQQLLRIAADAVVMHFHDLDLAFRVDHEAAAQGEAGIFDQYFEIARQRRSGIANQRVLHLFDGVRRVMPRLVGEMRIGGYAVNLHAQFLEFGIVVGKIAEFGRAHEREIRRIEHEHGPLALESFVRHRDELAIVVGRGLEWLDFGIDQGH